MTVTIIRKQSGQANEVTDAMLEAGIALISNTYCADIYKAMEAARIAEGGEIERIEVTNEYGEKLENYPSKNGVNFIMKTNVTMPPDEVIEYAEALLELGKQMKGAV